MKDYIKKYIIESVGILVLIVLMFLLIQSQTKLNGLNTRIDELTDDLDESYTLIDSMSNDAYVYQPKLNLTYKERDLIERVVAAEARGEDIKGQIYVASVIYNRMVLYNDSATTVLTEYDTSRQFAEPYQGHIDTSVKLVVRGVFDQDNVVPDVLYFVNPETARRGDYKWFRENLSLVGTIGCHEFYK